MGLSLLGRSEGGREEEKGSVRANNNATPGRGRTLPNATLRVRDGVAALPHGQGVRWT